MAVPTVGGVAALAAVALHDVNTSIEVFDIDNQTRDKEYDYFCKGTTTELMRRLMQLRGVQVRPLHSPRAGASSGKLGRFALDGIMQAHHGQVRLSMQLTDNEQGTLVWSDNFERQRVENPLELQSEIARGAVAGVENHILLGRFGAQGQRGMVLSAAARMRELFAFQNGAALSAAPTRSNAAFDLYMRGHNLLEELSPGSARAAIDYFKRAIDEDPDFALAFAAMADAQMALMNYNYLPHPELAKNARYYAAKAVERDPHLAEAHTVIAAVRQMDWDWKGAAESYLEALRLKPKLARARRWYAGLILQFGRFEDAIAEARVALDQDPYDRSAPPAFGLYLFLAGKYRESVDVLSAAIARKDMLMTRHNLGQVYARLGYTTTGLESANYYRRALEQAHLVAASESSERSAEGPTPYGDQLYAVIYSLMSNSAAAQPFLSRLDKDMDAGGTSPVTLAWIYAIQRHEERAMALLYKAAAWRDRRMLYIKVNPFLENLHSAPGFRALLNEMQL